MIYRHGDVNLIRVSMAEFEEAKKRGQIVKNNGQCILAKGEATGSIHELSCSDMEIVQDGDTLWLRLGDSGTLTHTSDHETLKKIAPDYYRQVPERECDHFSDSVVRKVVD